MKIKIETIAQEEIESPSNNMGYNINGVVEESEGQGLEMDLIAALNNHPPFTDYAGLIRWIWERIKEAARWLYDKLFGED